MTTRQWTDQETRAEHSKQRYRSHGPAEGGVRSPGAGGEAGARELSLRTGCSDLRERFKSRSPSKGTDRSMRRKRTPEGPEAETRWRPGTAACQRWLHGYTDALPDQLSTCFCYWDGGGN